MPWQNVKVAGGVATTMAEAINAEPGARADVEPSIALLFAWAKAGKAGNQSAEILRSPSFAFGAWMSKWTELREELHGRAPVIPEAARPKRPDAKPWQAAEREAEDRKARDRMEGRNAMAALTAQLADSKALG